MPALKQRKGKGSSGNCNVNRDLIHNLLGLIVSLSCRIAGSLARDVAKNLKVEEYNLLFGLDDGVHDKWSSNVKAQKSTWCW